MTESAIVLFAHGSREPEWVRPFERMRDRVAAALGEDAVRLAYLEHAQPPLDQAIAALYAGGARRVTVVPLFLAAGGHLKRDLPRMLEDITARHSGLSVHATPPLGELEVIVDAISGWIVRNHTAG